MKQHTGQFYRERIQIMLNVHNIPYGLVGMIEDDKHTLICTRVVLIHY
jgi:ATP-dependent Clp protease adapter protein ClpS